MLHKIYGAQIGALVNNAVEVDEKRLCHGYQCGFLFRYVEIVDKGMLELRRQQAAAECRFVVALAGDE